MNNDHWLKRFAFPISVVFILLFWEISVRLFQIPSYVIAAPTEIMQALWRGLALEPTNRGSYWFHLIFTLRGAFLGYIIGGIMGIVLGSLMAEYRILEKIIMPYAIALQTLPKVAIAPLIMIWFGFGLSSKIVLASLLTFFPLLVNTFVGLTMADPDTLKLMRGLQASRWQIFYFVKFPGALPLIFSGLNMSMVYALLGAIVAEFVGSQAGIGVMILQSQFTNDTAGVFGALVLLATVGIALHRILQIAERRAVFWAQRNQTMVTS